MYKMIKAASYNGTNKLDAIAAIHSLYGYFYTEPVVGKYICFVYDDPSEMMLCSTTICDVQHIDNEIRIKTENREYWFEKITKLEEE